MDNMFAPKSNNKRGKLLFEYLQTISDDENSEIYLKEDGLDPDQLVRDSIKKLKQAKMLFASNSVQVQYSVLQQSLSEKIRSQVDKILSDAAFNLAAFVKKENINVAYRNLNDMSIDEVREFLERHFLLKAKNDSNEK